MTWWQTRTLRAQLKSNRSEDFLAALETIKRLGHEKDHQSVPLLLEALSHHNLHVPLAAMKALAEMGDVRALEPLLNYAIAGRLSDQDKHDIVRTLGAKGFDYLTDELIRKNGSERRRQDAANWIVYYVGLLGSGTVERLGQALNSQQDPIVQSQIVDILGETTDAHAVQPLIRVLNSSIGYAREGVIRALCKVAGATRDAGALRALADCCGNSASGNLRDYSKPLFQSVLSTLQKGDNGSVVGPLIASMDHYNSAEIVQAVEHLLKNSAASIDLGDLRELSQLDEVWIHKPPPGGGFYTDERHAVNCHNVRLSASAEIARRVGATSDSVV